MIRDFKYHLVLSLVPLCNLAAPIAVQPNDSTIISPQVRITQLRRFDQNVPLAPFAQNLTVRHYDNYLEK